jgi:hypothetical protein
METLVGNDIAIYIRSGMDDHYIVPQTAAINCMHALLISPAGKISFQRSPFSGKSKNVWVEFMKHTFEKKWSK